MYILFFVSLPGMYLSPKNKTKNNNKKQTNQKQKNKNNKQLKQNKQKQQQQNTFFAPSYLNCRLGKQKEKNKTKQNNNNNKNTFFLHQVTWTAGVVGLARLCGAQRA